MIPIGSASANLNIDQFTISTCLGNLGIVIKLDFRYKLMKFCYEIMRKFNKVVE